MQEAVKKHFKERASDFGLAAAKLQVSLIASSSDFGHGNFKVGDGQAWVFVKLSADEDKQNRMRQWARQNLRLSGHFQAPRLLSWLDLEGCGGLALEYIEGHRPDLSGESNLFGQAVDLLDKLHADAELAKALTPETCTRKMHDSLLQRFVYPILSDIAETEEAWPAEVDEATRTRFHEEVEVLERLAQDSPAFSPLADSPVHGNYRVENLLVTPKGWYVMDWDDLRLGDPALDFATLFWSLDEGGLGEGTEGLLEVFKGQPDLQERLPLYFRALLFQEAAGSLVDWVRAADYPEQTAAVREAKWKRHQQASVKYKAMYH
jgi:hypothetical protein